MTAVLSFRVNLAQNMPFLATVSDKQRALINTLEATWSDLPHQYCDGLGTIRVHYLSFGAVERVCVSQIIVGAKVKCERGADNFCLFRGRK